MVDIRRGKYTGFEEYAPNACEFRKFDVTSLTKVRGNLLGALLKNKYKRRWLT